MFCYDKKLQYPVNIKKKNLKMAKLMLTQYGGPQAELGAAIRYLNQRYTMPTKEGKALLTDIGTEELGHVEMICTMISQMVKGATKEEMVKEGLGAFYTDHGFCPFPSDANGVPFTTAYISTLGNPVVDLQEDLAAEAKAKAVYEHLIDLTDDPDIIGPLLFLRQREVVHFNRFNELLQKYKQMGL